MVMRAGNRDTEHVNERRARQPFGLIIGLGPQSDHHLFLALTGIQYQPDVRHQWLTAPALDAHLAQRKRANVRTARQVQT